MLLALAPDLAASGLSAYAWAFGQGVLVDLTPCVYPLIPITVSVFGAQGVSKPRAMALASSYVLGMATLYTALGVGVSLAGGAFGAWLGNPFVVAPIVLMMVALSASMFGAFELQLPSSVQTRLGMVGGASPVGAFLMGLVSGLISAPCTGPVLLSLLAYIAKASSGGGSVVYGGSLLFTYALGMGSLFFAVALGASLFRPGAWMEKVKSVFGVAMLVMAAWFLRPVWPALADFTLDPAWGLWAGLGLVAVGIVGGAVHLSFYDRPAVKARKAVMVAVATAGATIALNNALYVPPMAWTHVTDAAGLRAALADAQDRPVVVDFAASWCMPCKEFELKTFHDAAVEPVLAREFALIKVDVTEGTDEQEQIKRAFHSQTLPSVNIYAAGHGLAGVDLAGDAPEPATRFNTYVEAEPFLDGLNRAL